MSRPRLLGVLLCYNDGDFLADALTHLLANEHHVVVWNHGSTDETSTVLQSFRRELVEVTDISRAVDFYDLYPMMSHHLMTNYVTRYDWITWPDQDEIVEGPTRAKRYCEFLADAVASPHAWIEFDDFVYWFTERDDPAVASACERIRHYSLARHGAQKIRAWRASATNVRWFNHNAAIGSRYPSTFRLRHYPMRSESQMWRRLNIDRAGLQRGQINYHYENMKSVADRLRIAAGQLHADDGVSELDETMKFDWRSVYGNGPKLPNEIAESYLLTTRCWEIAQAIKQALTRLPPHETAVHRQPRLARWLAHLDARIGCPVLVAFRRGEVKIITADLSREWEASGTWASDGPNASCRTIAMLEGLRVTVVADAATRSLQVRPTKAFHEHGERLIALVPRSAAGPPRMTPLTSDGVTFEDLPSGYYYLTCEPGTVAIDGGC